MFASLMAASGCPLADPWGRPPKIQKMGGCPKRIILLTNLLTKLFIFDRQCGGVRSADLFVDSCRDGALRFPWRSLLLAGVAFGAPGLSLDVIFDPQGCSWLLLAAPGCSWRALGHLEPRQTTLNHFKPS